VKVISVAALAERAVADGGRMISVPRTVSLLREAMPSCEHTDDELAHLVAIIAVSKGRDLSFVR